MIKPGNYIRIVDMDGEPQYAGRTGIVTHIDSLNQIHGTWGGCALIPGTDSFEVLYEKMDCNSCARHGGIGICGTTGFDKYESGTCQKWRSNGKV